MLPLAESSWAFLAALPAALAMLILTYVWVLGTDVPFEEGSAELSEKIAELRRRGPSALRKPRVRASVPTPFELSFDGRHETAILWKNLMLLSRAPWTWWVSGSILVLLAVSLLPAVLDPPGFVLAIVGAFGWIFALFLPLFLSLGLRNDFAPISRTSTWCARGRWRSAVSPPRRSWVPRWWPRPPAASEERCSSRRSWGPISKPRSTEHHRWSCFR